MQRIYLDLAQANPSQRIYAKQADVGRKFQAVITDADQPYSIEPGTVFTVWYSGTSGEGNYSSVGENSAIVWQDNVVQVELITQMLQCHGGGTMCLVMHNADGTQIGLWNLLYICEPVPGMQSQEAAAYYTALSEAAQKAIVAAQNFTLDETLSVSGSPADAGAVGSALEGKAPAGFGLGAVVSSQTAKVTDLNELPAGTGLHYCTASTLNAPDDAFGGGPLLAMNWRENELAGQLLMNNDLSQMYCRRYKDGTWTGWKYLNPPMKAGVEYATMEKWLEKTVYTKLVDCGVCEDGKRVAFDDTIRVIRYCGTIGSVAVPAISGSPSSPSSYAQFYINSSGIRISCPQSIELIGMQAYCRIWYTKD